MKKIINLIAFVFVILLFSACNDLLEPELDNALEENEILDNPTLAEGVLLKAYTGLPNDIFPHLNSAVASDDATSNDINSSFVNMATGGWQADFNPLSEWDNAYKHIQYLNLFIDKIDQVKWSPTSSDLDDLHRMRLRGEAHGLRAWYQFQLLQSHSGNSNGSLKGYPITTNLLTIEDDLFIPRGTFQECVDQIVSDCDIAIENIAASYENAVATAVLNGKVEMEDYDEGGQDVGYNDLSPGNNGNQYRMEDVDIEVSSAGGFNVGWTQDGEWLNFSFEKILSGTYTISASVASNSNAPGSVRILIGDDANSLEELVTIQAENTGGWQTWQEFSAENVNFTDGGFDKLIRVEFVGGDLNIDYINFELTSDAPRETTVFNGREYNILEYDQAMGERWRNRFNGSAAFALKSKVLLYAASPAYQSGSNVSWEDAATLTGNFLQASGGLNTVVPDGLTFYKSSLNEDIIWNNSQRDLATWETQNFPPSQFGLGRTNPSQNLVDAFPMSNGYPITDPSSGYSPNLPYIGRDNRLSTYILTNGGSFKGSTINTYIGAESDGINSIITSTRTGYYLKKFMDESVNLVVGSVVETKHNFTHFRFTEVLLNYAEAANEAWGPDADPEGFGFTARSIISALRGRAGISQPDDYMNSLNSKDAFRELIRNERRLELCFEGHRFWDIRRWNETATMKEPIQGAFIEDDQFTINIRDVENRVYQDFMIYGPIPFSETLNYDIGQNEGW